MKTTILIIAAATFLVSCKKNKQPEEVDKKEENKAVSTMDGYGKTKWGMSPEKVKELYPEAEDNLKEHKSLILESQKIVDREASVSFAFEEDKLVGAGISFKLETWGPGEPGNREFKKYNDLHDGLLSLLKEKYGKPSRSEKIKSGETNPLTGGILSGTMLWSHWDAGKTVVVLVCLNDECKISGPMILYSSKDLHPFPKKAVTEGL